MIAVFFILLCFAGATASGAQVGISVYEKHERWVVIMWAMLAFINAVGVAAWTLVLLR